MEDNIPCIQYLQEARTHQRMKHLDVKYAFIREIIRSDKGKRMVVMKKEDYNNKMLKLLDDPTYEVLKKDPTSKITKQTNDIINRLYKLKLIDKKTATTLEAKNSIRPCIYGQPKAHKPDLPLRPVVPNITAPTYKLAKYVCQILQSSFNSQYNIKDSFQLIRVLQQVKLPPDYILVSFDVVSLFTNTPKRLIIHDIIMNWDTIGKATNINLDIFIEMIELCLESCYFIFGQKFYRQKEGTAMGSPTSPILCDLVMEGLLRNCTKKLDFPVPLLIKYVDDLLLALPNNQLTHVLQTFNSYHPKMQFTMETAKNNSIAFLDTFITINEDRTLSTEWYSKDISSGRLLNYHSFHPISVKLNVARNFVKRVIKFDSRNQKSKQHTTIHRILRQNNYPKQLINRIINRENHIHQHEQSTTPNITIAQHPTDQHPTEQHPIEQHPTQQQPAIIPPTQQQHKPNNEDHQSTAQTATESSINPPQIRYFPLTFIPNLSSHITKILKTDYAEIHIANCIPKPLGMLLPRAKDPIASSETPNIIYSIPCSSCPKQYIGMSRNNLKTRLVGHKSRSMNSYLHGISHKRTPRKRA
ncbi:uncharacterized protein LOC129742954 [Uranotaenia lowii]|uniref:uncharacterized protein LOC129742954 n=1 Tax=Uranotaenia lowii TaxID=190385 RepID=UPI00247B298A|nr:uncharacterized protein LOC129742954 [Uranotaenia lowii]